MNKSSEVESKRTWVGIENRVIESKSCSRDVKSRSIVKLS